MGKYKWFREDMSSDEARKILFSLSEKHPNSKDEIFEEYSRVYSTISKREIELALQGEID